MGVYGHNCHDPENRLYMRLTPMPSILQSHYNTKWATFSDLLKPNYSKLIGLGSSIYARMWSRACNLSKASKSVQRGALSCCPNPRGVCVRYCGVARFWYPERMCLGIEDIIIQADHVRVREDEVQILERLSNPEALCKPLAHLILLLKAITDLHRVNLHRRHNPHVVDGCMS
jgi:hypothetical protein